MSTTIWKFPINLTTGIQNIKMPKGAKVLTVQGQFDEPMMWAEVNPSNEIEERQFEIIATGRPMEKIDLYLRKYISTFQTDAGNYVFHAYEIQNALSSFINSRFTFS